MKTKNMCVFHRYFHSFVMQKWCVHCTYTLLSDGRPYIFFNDRKCFTNLFFTQFNLTLICIFICITIITWRFVKWAISLLVTWSHNFFFVLFNVFVQFTGFKMKYFSSNNFLLKMLMVIGNWCCLNRSTWHTYHLLF